MYIDRTSRSRGQRHAVFDKGVSRTKTSPSMATHHTALGVARRDEKDRRVGTPVTAKLLGDPDPDRVAKAEALRLSILASDKRRARIAETRT